MLKRLLSMLLAVLLIFCLAACGGDGKEVKVDTNSSDKASAGSSSNGLVVNSLTGIAELSKDKADLRPVAIMVDNDANAQISAQSGISEADIVYETETEGGITRLMALFQDIESAPQIGDIRSARYDFVDLAMGHNAIYVHHGKDTVYCEPHLADLDNFEISTNTGAWRQTYGNVYSWQTLFTTGEKLAAALKSKKWQLTQETTPLWQTFAKEGETVTLSGGEANKATAAFNGSYKSIFTYDKESGNYIKTSNKVANKDRNNGAKYEFKNVFLLKTGMSYFGEGENYRRDIDLSSGEGYYLVNGKYEKIKWKKGNDSDPLVFTKADGTTLKVNTGNSWVCFINKDSTISFE